MILPQPLSSSRVLEVVPELRGQNTSLDPTAWELPFQSGGSVIHGGLKKPKMTKI